VLGNRRGFFDIFLVGSGGGGGGTDCTRFGEKNNFSPFPFWRGNH